MVHVKVMKQDMYVYVMTDTVVLIVIQVCYTYIYIYIYKSNTTGATCETGTDYPTGNPVSPLPVFSAG